MNSTITPMGTRYKGALDFSAGNKTETGRFVLLSPRHCKILLGRMNQERG